MAGPGASDDGPGGPQSGRPQSGRPQSAATPEEGSELRPVVTAANTRPAIEVARELVRLRLVDKQTVRRVLPQLPAGHGEALVNALQQTGELTDFQAGEVRRGMLDYLALGPVRPQYLISAGAFARVFRGVDVRHPPGHEKANVAIKILRERWRGRPGMVDMFRREGEMGRRLTHQNIVPTWDVDCDGPIPYLTMEFVEGGDLRAFLKIRGKLSPGEALRAGLDICRGLEYALQFGVAHRDMKLSNVLMSPSGTARLIDFGLAADDSLLDEAEQHNALEYSTLERYAEEFFREKTPPGGDPRTDLYLLGTILYELVAGVPPYPRTGNRQERKAVSRYRNVPPVTTHEPELPFEVSSLIERLMLLDPTERFQTPTETATAIQAALAKLGEGVAVAGAKTADGRTLRTLLCVESRPKHQDVLREYFSKHGFRVLLLGNPDRALARLDTTPPDALVLMADAIGADAVDHFRTAITHARPPACVLVLPRKAKGIPESLASLPDHAKVVPQPTTTRDVRDAVEAALAAR